MSKIDGLASVCNKYFGRPVGAQWNSAEELAGAVVRNESFARGVFSQLVEDSLMVGTAAIDKLAPNSRLTAAKEHLSFGSWTKDNPTLGEIVSKAPDSINLGWEIDKRIKARNLAETGGELRVKPEELLRMSYANFDELVGQMSIAIRAGRWSSILVEGVSGKPVGDVLAEVMRLHSVHAGKSAPFIEYIATRGAGNIRPGYLSNLSTRIDGLKSELGSGRVLVVTEAIAGGASIRPILQKLERSHRYDVASLYNAPRDIREIIAHDNSGFDSAPSKWRPSGYEAFGGMKVGRAKDEDQVLQARVKDARGLREAIGIDVDKSRDSVYFYQTESYMPASKIDLHRTRVARFDMEIKKLAEELYAKHFK